MNFFQTKAKVGASAAAVLLLLGCGKSEDPITPVVPNAQKSVAPVAATTANVPPPTAPTAPPPAAPTPTPAVPSANGEEPKELKSPDGKTLSTIDYLQSIVSGYSRTRASQGEGSMPALTSIEQLVQYRIIARLPKAPDGQKFILDPQTGKVALAPL